MRYAILSDVHSNLEALRAVLDAISGEDAGRIVCLGDIVGYNADPGPCVSLLREAGAHCVAGNHDRAVTGQITTDGFNPLAARAVAWTRGQLGAEAMDFLRGLPLKASFGSDLVAVHGALHPDVGCELVRLDSDERRRLSFEALVEHPSGSRICAFGHTHRPGIHEYRHGTTLTHAGDEVIMREGAHYLVNPGTVGQPRTGDDRATYMVLDTERATISIRRVVYDMRPALSKTRKAGLAARLSRVPEPYRSVLRRIWRSVPGRGSQSWQRRLWPKPEA
ncbi:metallophosphoesterase family protein [Arenibaculum sp.]|uniref:metallophosphoesterase family protein n=1 Tax=Arenibaculum sp. TaxID=2865862 RepID=UPI002E101C19|nr:metallophosphoesterase family protein [Arenibaculum sp.]